MSIWARVDIYIGNLMADVMARVAWYFEERACDLRCCTSCGQSMFNSPPCIKHDA